jgi:hypothetical protein
MEPTRRRTLRAAVDLARRRRLSQHPCRPAQHRSARNPRTSVAPGDVCRTSPLAWGRARLLPDGARHSRGKRRRDSRGTFGLLPKGARVELLLVAMRRDPRRMSGGHRPAVRYRRRGAAGGSGSRHRVGQSKGRRQRPGTARRRAAGGRAVARPRGWPRGAAPGVRGEVEAKGGEGRRGWVGKRWGEGGGVDGDRRCRSGTRTPDRSPPWPLRRGRLVCGRRRGLLESAPVDHCRGGVCKRSRRARRAAARRRTGEGLRDVRRRRAWNGEEPAGGRDRGVARLPARRAGARRATLPEPG